MIELDNEEKIGVIIENLEAVSSKQKAHIFDTEGGFIGSDSQCDFYVQDKDKKIHSKHLKIGFEEGFFTISPIEDAPIFYNESFSKMQGGFEVAINKGDVFRIENVQFRFVDSAEIDDELLKSKESLNNLEQYEEIDDNLLQPRGKVAFTFQEKENIREIVESKADYAFMEQKESDDFLNQDSNQIILNTTNILHIIDKMLSELKQEQQHIILDDKCEQIEDLETIITNTPLIKSTKLINILALGIISRELYSPIFEMINRDKKDGFAKYIQSAIQKSIKDDKHSFESLIIRALEKYLQK
ncbi:FHA domain-containing protein [Helicobacter sp. T3_23-1056]